MLVRVFMYHATISICRPLWYRVVGESGVSRRLGLSVMSSGKYHVWTRYLGKADRVSLQSAKRAM